MSISASKLDIKIVALNEFKMRTIEEEINKQLNRANINVKASMSKDKCVIETLYCVITIINIAKHLLHGYRTDLLVLDDDLKLENGYVQDTIIPMCSIDGASAVLLSKFLESDGLTKYTRGIYNYEKTKLSDEAFQLITKEKQNDKVCVGGVEALILMKDNGTEFESLTSGLRYLYDNNSVHFLANEQGEWRKATTFPINENFIPYIEPKPLIGWERVDKNTEDYFSIAMSGNIQKENKYFGIKYNTLCDSANAFSTKEKAEEINFKQTLFRKLQRFSDENGGSKINWNDEDQDKYYIYYDHQSKRLEVNLNWCIQEYGKIYFISEEVAEKALELFHDDLIKYFTQY